MNESVLRCASLNLSQTNQVTSLEVAVAMLKFPEGGLGVASMKDIAHYVINEPSSMVVQGEEGRRGEGWAAYALPLWNPYMFN